MTFADAVKEHCLECKKPLSWNGFKGYEYLARCCGYLYRLEPQVLEYNFVVSKITVDDESMGVIPGKNGSLFHHPV